MIITVRLKTAIAETVTPSGDMEKTAEIVNDQIEDSAASAIEYLQKLAKQYPFCIIHYAIQSGDNSMIGIYRGDNSDDSPNLIETDIMELLSGNGRKT